VHDLFQQSAPKVAAPITKAQKLDWIRLTRSENVGPVTFLRLLERFGTPANALQAIPELSKRGGSKRVIKVCSVEDAQKEIEAAQLCDAVFVAYGSTEYPALLANIHDPPPFLWVRGNTALLSQKSVGIVGARNSSAAGSRFAAHIARALTDHDYCVVSGLARGIDAAAHASVLNNNGMTVSAVAGGVDVVWPPETGAIAERIWQEGASVSEMPIAQQPRNRHFPRRNRIIAGVSRGIIMVEAAQKSGSLITARYALDQGREVLAVPGSPLDARAAGCNDLIRKGATLIRNIDDVLESLSHWDTLSDSKSMAEPTRGFQTMPPISPAEADLERGRDAIITLLSPTPTLVDDIITQSGASVPIVQSILLELDLAGRLERHRGGYVSLNTIPD